MFDEIDKSELTAPGARYKRASDVFDKQFDFHMQQRRGDVGAAVGDMLAMSEIAPEMGEAIIFKSLCVFAAEAKAAQRVLAMAPAQRLTHAQELFAARFAECMRACAGNVAEVCEQLLAAALCDQELGSAMIYLHLCYFMEALGKKPLPATAKPN